MTGMRSSRSAIPQVAGLHDTRRRGYSHVVRVGEILFLAGQCGLDEHGKIVSSEFGHQAKRAMERVRLALEAAGATISDIVNMTVYLVDVGDADELLELRNEFYADYFPEDSYPASTTIVVDALLPQGGLVEIQVQATLAQ